MFFIYRDSMLIYKTLKSNKISWTPKVSAPGHHRSCFVRIQKGPNHAILGPRWQAIKAALKMRCSWGFTTEKMGKNGKKMGKNWGKMGKIWGFQDRKMVVSLLYNLLLRSLLHLLKCGKLRNPGTPWSFRQTQQQKISPRPGLNHGRQHQQRLQIILSTRGFPLTAIPTTSAANLWGPANIQVPTCSNWRSKKHLGKSPEISLGISNILQAAVSSNICFRLSTNASGCWCFTHVHVGFSENWVNPQTPLFIIMIPLTCYFWASTIFGYTHHPYC